MCFQLQIQQISHPEMRIMNIKPLRCCTSLIIHPCYAQYLQTKNQIYPGTPTHVTRLAQHSFTASPHCLHSLPTNAPAPTQQVRTKPEPNQVDLPTQPQSNINHPSITLAPPSALGARTRARTPRIPRNLNVLQLLLDHLYPHEKPPRASAPTTARRN